MKKKILLGKSTVIDLRKKHRFALKLDDIIQPEPGAIYQVKITFKRAYSILDCPTDEQENSGEEEAEKFLENDLYTLYETEKVFGELIQNTDFTNYLNSKFAYGVKDIAPVNTANENIDNLEEDPEVDLIEG